MTTTWICTTEEAPWTEATPAAADGPANLRVTDERRQAWRGFGGCFNELGARALRTLPRDGQERVLDELFGREPGCGFNYCRVPIGASDYATSWYSHDETPGDYAMEHFSIDRDRALLIPYIRDAMARRDDLLLFASPWSPPTWMKHPQAYNHGRLLRDERTLAAYAEYFARFVRAYRDEGLPVEAVHVQNEPNSDQKFPSCVWTGAEMRDFIRDDLGPRFARDDVDCEIWAGTFERPTYDAWVHTILRDAGAAQYVAGLGFQWAGKGCVQKARLAWPDIPLIQTENECGDGRNDWGHALHVYDLLWHYITNGVSAYVYWNMILQPGGGSTWGWKQNALITIDPETGAVTHNPEYFVMKHAAGFVAPGAHVRAVAGSWAANAFAFERPDGGTVVLVCNPLAEAHALTLEAGGGRIAASLPPRSVHTFVFA